MSPNFNPNLVVKDLPEDNRNWDLEKKLKCSFVNPKGYIYDIHEIYLFYQPMENKRIWPFSKRGKVPVKSAYKIIGHG